MQFISQNYCYYWYWKPEPKERRLMSNVYGQKCLSLLQQNYQACVDLESPITFAQINHHCGCFRETNLLLIFVPLTLSLDYWFQLFQAEKEPRYWIIIKGNLRNRDMYLRLALPIRKLNFKKEMATFRCSPPKYENWQKIRSTRFSCILHCTMRLSTKVENSKVLKSKGLVFARFWSKSDNSSSDWWTTVQILKEKYSHHIFAKKWCIYWQKTWRGCRINFKFCTQLNYPVPKKKPSK